MKKLIFDCDNTMGVEGCDVDDGLALLYLLGKKDIDITGITTTYGNSDVEIVYSNTCRIVKELGISTPVLKGALNKTTLDSPAARFIVESVNANKNKISILATGSLTNLYGAYRIDNTIFEKVCQIVLMGGVTELLLINGKLLPELNFSCHPEAALCVLKNCKNVSVITGNTCLKAYFTYKKFSKELSKGEQSIAGYITKNNSYWFDKMKLDFEMDGFYNWDVVAAVFFSQPDLFCNNFKRILFIKSEFNCGLLCVEDYNNLFSELPNINFPTIKNSEVFENEVYRAWIGVEIPLEH